VTVSAPNKATKPTRTAIGWREWVSLPGLGVARIKAKIDTGAKTAALHAFRIETVERSGKTYVHFAVHPIQKAAKPEILCRARVKCRRRIRSSNGVIEERLILRVKVKAGEREFPIDLSLANRDSMGFRLLLGRDAVRRKFLIDPGASFLLGRPRKRKSS